MGDRKNLGVGVVRWTTRSIVEPAHRRGASSGHALPVRPRNRKAQPIIEAKISFSYSGACLRVLDLAVFEGRDGVFPPEAESIDQFVGVWRDGFLPLHRYPSVSISSQSLA
jgi:hypothetical protein